MIKTQNTRLRPRATAGQAKHKIQNFQQGFTLVEMIAVVGVFAIIMVAVSELFIGISGLSRTTDSTRTITQEARYALDVMSREIRAAGNVNVVDNAAPATDSITAYTKDGNQIAFDISGGRVRMTKNGSIVQYLTSDKTNIAGFNVDSSTRAEKALSQVNTTYPPMGLAVNNITHKVYVTRSDDGAILVYDGTTNPPSLINTISNLSGDTSITINPTTKKFYVSNYNQNRIYYGSTETDTITGFRNTGGPPNFCARPIGNDININTNKIYTASWDCDKVLVMDGATDTITGAVVVGDRPYDVAVNPNTNKIYSANMDSNSVSVIDGNTNTVTATIPVGITPRSIAVNPVTNKIYTGNTDYGSTHSVSVIDGNTNTVIKAINFSNRVKDVAVNTTLNRIYIMAYDTIQVYDGISDAKIGQFGNGPYSPDGINNIIAVDNIANRIYTGVAYAAPGPYLMQNAQADIIQPFLKITITAEGKVKDRTGNVPKTTIETIVSQSRL